MKRIKTNVKMCPIYPEFIGECVMDYAFQSPLLNDLNNRYYIYQATDAEAIDQLFCSGKQVVFYLGYDPTASSLHVGHLLWIKLVNKLQNAGHKPIVLVGGATGKIGDPTWKETQRKMLSYETILDNIASISRKLSTLVKFTGDNAVIPVNNDEWLSKLKYMDFLREYGSLFSVNKMLAMDSVSTRLERQQHLSFLEFNYMILQAYDFLHLFETYNCVLQIGGQDQWSNMTHGVDLVRRKTGKDVFGMSIPLLVNSDGKKMGKTEAGVVWLDEKLLPPFDFWQYWRNVDDRDVVKLLKIFTDLPLEEIEKYSAFIGTSKINEAKIILADSVTSFVHPTADLNAIKQSASSGTHSDAIEEFRISSPMSLDKVLKECGLAESATQAKRLVEGGGVKIDGVQINKYDTIVDHSCLIAVGKKKLKKILV